MKATFKTLTANPTYTAAKIFATSYLLFVLYLSFSHLISLALHYGSHNAWVAPLLVDSLMLMGKMIRSPQFTAGCRRTGAILQYGAALVSLAANILAGDNLADRVIGAGVIAGFLVVESIAHRIKPVQVDNSAAKAAAKTAAAAKAAATRRANKAAADRLAAETARKAAEKRERNAERRRMAREIADVEAAANGKTVTTAVAPVSPAPTGLGRSEIGYL